jgi:group I intron endonuclease
MLICKENSKFYIGSSVNMYDRVKAHKSELINNKHGNRYLQNTANKYREGFDFLVLEECERELVRIKEQYWMLKMNPVLNLTMVVDGRISHTEETRAKLSKARKGVPISEEHKRKVIESFKYIDRTGKVFNDIEKAKMRKNIPQSKWVKVNGIKYDSIKYASQMTNISRQALSDIVNGKTKVIKHKDIFSVETENFKKEKQILKWE